VVKPDNDTRRIATFKNGHLRLLMKLVGLRRVGDDDDPEASWTVPSSLSADQLKEALSLIQKSEFSPPTFDDGEEAGDFIRRKSAETAARKKAVFDDEDDDLDDNDEEEFLFPAGGPTAMKKSDALKALKKSRRRRKKESSEDEGTGLTDEQLEARAEARRQRELEKNRKIKSDLYVHDSDEEPDENRDRVFFEQEEKIRERAKITIMKELLNVGKDKGSTKSKSKKRQSDAISADEDDEDEDDLADIRPRKRQSSVISVDSDGDGHATGRSSSVARDNILDKSDKEATDTPLSSPHTQTTKSKRRKVSGDDEEATPATIEPTKSDAMEIDDDDDEDVAPVSRPIRQRTRGGFIVDSSDEE
jgi:replication fork protection complex subunit Tof1/Swi1